MLRLPLALASLSLTFAGCARSTPPATSSPATAKPVATESAPAPEVPAPEGPLRYRGEVPLPGTEPLIFYVELLPSAMGHLGTVSLPDHGAFDVPLADVTTTGGEVTFTLRPPGIEWTAHIDTEGRPQDCLFQQNGVSLACTLEAIGEPELTALRNPPRPQTPQPPFPYDAVEVQVHNTTDDVTLAGTLTLPQPPGPHPAALLITGSGAQDRDETLMFHKPFWVLADHLTRQGIAVLRLDDRGVGGSTGNLVQSSQAALVRDAAAAVAWLRADPRIDPARIGLIGHSEGGIIGPRVAANDPEIAFVVMMAGTGVPGHQIVVEQVAAALRATGAPATTIELARHQQAKVMKILIDHGPEQARPKLEDLLGTGSPRIEPLLTPWYQSFIRFDPVPALSALRCPVLVLNGELDIQVLPDQNLPPIEQALAGNRARTTIHRLPGLNHLFQHAQTGAAREYNAIEETIAPEVLELIGDWVVAQTDPAAKQSTKRTSTGRKKKTKR